MPKISRAYLKEKFPELYIEGCLVYGASCGDGWSEIIEDGSRKLLELIKTRQDLPRPIPLQIKEKFGSLRFYIEGNSKEAEDIIREMSITSERTCEVCGKPGEMRNEGWIKCLCEVCDKNRN